MDNPIGLIRSPKTLSVMPTFTCPAACTDCGTLSSPHEKATLKLDTMLAAIKQAKELNFGNVVFTGGEPTLRWNDLKKAINFAKNLGLPTRIVTNAHWAFTYDKAIEKLKDLILSGLDEINFSTGDEHARFIPIERVVYGIKASLALNLKPHIMIELRERREVTRKVLINALKDNGLDENDLKLVDISESPWMPLDPMSVEDYPCIIVANSDNIHNFQGCESILQTYVIQSDGRIGSCCGLGLRTVAELNVANVNQENFLHEAVKISESDIVKLWIHYFGTEKILKWAADKNPSIMWENMYAHKCQACMRIFKDYEIKSVILDHYEEILGELIMNIYLEEQLAPVQMQQEEFMLKYPLSIET